ncbi:hypothetical protein, partial [Veronia pacifica]|uniref:hypothetical protein n=1 Tax=Veronia pacifica TaxID=1080227 RepID=UPI001586820D
LVPSGLPLTLELDTTADVGNDFAIVPALSDGIYNNDEYENNSFSLQGSIQLISIKSPLYSAWKEGQTTH